MFIQKISAQNSAFGLNLKPAIQKEIEKKRHLLLTHPNTDARKEFKSYLNANLRYIKNTLPDKDLDLIENDEKNHTRTYTVSDNDNSYTIHVHGNDSFYCKLAKEIKKLPHRNFNSVAK